MDSLFVFDEKTLKRVPPLFTLIFILLLGAPAIAIHYFGATFNAFAQDPNGDQGFFVIDSQLRSYFVQVLLQWTAFSLAAITTLLAFAQYRLTHDKVALLIGVTLLMSGSIDTLHTLFLERLSHLFQNNEQLDRLLGAMTGSINNFLLITGLLWLLHDKKALLSTFLFFVALAILLSLVFVSYTELITSPPSSIQHSFLTRPYELIFLSACFMILLFIYPHAYKKYPSILTQCALYMSIAQLIIAGYLLFYVPKDSPADFLPFFRIITYFIPFSCFMINYIFSYNAILKAQHSLKIEQEKLTYIASHDALTNLYNRREFENILSRTLANHARNDEPFAVFLIDLDDFKSINDNLGHLQGDQFLKRFADKLKTLTRQGDTLSRIGGDEFTVIMAKLSSPTSARKLVERIIHGLTIPYFLDAQWMAGTVSVGIALYPADGTTTEALLQHADIALYHAKNSGKNTYRFYTDKLSLAQHREANLEKYLRDAIKKNELSLCYQPLYQLITREIIGAEILLRWTHPILGEISPEEFIPVAEHNHFILKIGNWVVHQACAQAKLWAEKYQRHLSFAIKVSPLQLSNNHFCLHFKKTLEKLDYPGDPLIIEITERLLMNSHDKVASRLSTVRSLGIQIAIDHYGRGYSSLSHLTALPIDLLKIDKAFIAEITPDTEKALGVDAIIQLAHELNMTTLAEGIETQAQLKYLIEKQCPIGQGFYLSKPLTKEAFEALAY